MRLLFGAYAGGIAITIAIANAIAIELEAKVSWRVFIAECSPDRAGILATRRPK